MAIRLIPFRKSHLPAFAELLTDPDVERFTRLPMPTPPDFPRTWLARYEAGRWDGSSEAFAVVDEAGEFLESPSRSGSSRRRRRPSSATSWRRPRAGVESGPRRCDS